MNKEVHIRQTISFIFEIFNIYQYTVFMNGFIFEIFNIYQYTVFMNDLTVQVNVTG